MPGLLPCVRHGAPCRGAPEGLNIQMLGLRADEKAVHASPGDAPAAGRAGPGGRGPGAGLVSVAQQFAPPCCGRRRVCGARSPPEGVRTATPPCAAPGAGRRRRARAVGWPCPGRVRRGERAWTSFSDRSSRTPYTGEPACRQPRLAAPGDCVPLRAPSWFRKDRWPSVGSSHARTPRTRARAHRHGRGRRGTGDGRPGERHGEDAHGGGWVCRAAPLCALYVFPCRPSPSPARSAPSRSLPPRLPRRPLPRRRSPLPRRPFARRCVATPPPAIRPREICAWALCSEPPFARVPRAAPRAPPRRPRRRHAPPRSPRTRPPPLRAPRLAPLRARS